MRREFLELLHQTFISMDSTARPDPRNHWTCESHCVTTAAWLVGLTCSDWNANGSVLVLVAVHATRSAPREKRSTSLRALGP